MNIYKLTKYKMKIKTKELLFLREDWIYKLLWSHIMESHWGFWKIAKNEEWFWFIKWKNRIKKAYNVLKWN